VQPDPLRGTRCGGRELVVLHEMQLRRQQYLPVRAAQLVEPGLRLVFAPWPMVGGTQRTMAGRRVGLRIGLVPYPWEAPVVVGRGCRSARPAVEADRSHIDSTDPAR